MTSTTVKPVPARQRISLGRVRALAASQLTWIVAAVVAALITVLFAHTLDYDPWSWVLWGRSLARGHLDLHGSTAWKPLPALVTLPLGAAAHLAPTAWLVVARTGGLLSFAYAFRLAQRLAGPVAGVVAVIGLLSTYNILGAFWLGNSEGLLVALTLVALLCAVEDRWVPALGAGFAAALLRPEVWPFLLLAGAWAWRRELVGRRWLLAGLVLVPIAWFVPQWLALGSPSVGQQLASTSPEARSIAALGHPFVTVIARAWHVLPLVLLAAAAAAVALAIRRRDRVVLVLSGGALAWTLLVALMAQLGYAGLVRFLLPAAAVGSVLSGVGLAAMVMALPPLGARLAALAAAAIVLVLALGPRATGLHNEAVSLNRLVAREQALPAAIRAAGGRRRLLHCGRPYTTPLEIPALVWQLGTRVRGLPYGTGPVILFTRHHHPGAGSDRLLAQTSQWTIRGGCH